MSSPLVLPSRPDLNWLKNRARERVAALRAHDPGAKLADAQLAVARDYGFPSWRALKAHVDALRAEVAAPVEAPKPLPDAIVVAFLREVAGGDLDAVRTVLDAMPSLVNTPGPHPFWGGRPQALHVAVESKRGAVVAFLLARGADVHGANAGYAHWSPLLLALHAGLPEIADALHAAGAVDGLAEVLLQGDDARLAMLLDATPDPLKGPWPSEGGPLRFARTPFAIDRLLALGADPAQRDLWGATVVDSLSRLGTRGASLVAHLAARGIKGTPAVAARLGDRRALEHALAADAAGVRAPETLRAAVEAKHHALVEWLLAQGADVNGRVNAPEFATSLHAAAWAGDLAMVRLLVAAGADRTAQDRKYEGTALDWAEKSVEVTRNPACAGVADYLRKL